MKIKETCFQWKKLVTCCSQWVSTGVLFADKKDDEEGPGT